MDNFEHIGKADGKNIVRIPGTGSVRLTDEEFERFKETGELPPTEPMPSNKEITLEERVRALENQFKGIGVVSQEHLDNVPLEGKEILEIKFAGDVLDAIEALGKRIEALEAIVTSAPAQPASKPEETPPAEDSKANRQRGNKPQ